MVIAPYGATLVNKLFGDYFFITLPYICHAMPYTLTYMWNCVPFWGLKTIQLRRWKVCFAFSWYMFSIYKLLVSRCTLTPVSIEQMQQLCKEHLHMNNTSHDNNLHQSSKFCTIIHKIFNQKLTQNHAFTFHTSIPTASIYHTNRIFTI